MDINIELAELVVLGNESLLTQCFGNLLDNAVKFVPPGSSRAFEFGPKPARPRPRL